MRTHDFEDLLRQKLKSEETLLHESRSKSDLVDRSVQGLAAKFQASMEAMEHRILSKMDLPTGNAGLDVGPGTGSQRSEVGRWELQLRWASRLHCIVKVSFRSLGGTRVAHSL